MGRTEGEGSSGLKFLHLKCMQIVETQLSLKKIAVTVVRQKHFNTWKLECAKRMTTVD